jgi:hypothetical protein
MCQGEAPEQHVADIIRIEVRVLVPARGARQNAKLVIKFEGPYALHCLERSGSILREMGSGRGSLRLTMGSLLLERRAREEAVEDMTISTMSPRSLTGVGGERRWGRGEG